MNKENGNVSGIFSNITFFLVSGCKNSIFAEYNAGLTFLSFLKDSLYLVSPHKGNPAFDVCTLI